jgi:hypothetical protein
VRIHLGAGVTDQSEVSPAVGVGLLTVFQDFNLGVIGSKYAMGPFLSYEFVREFNLGVSWNLLKWGTDARLLIFISYRF